MNIKKKVRDELKKIVLELNKEEILAIGLFGSITRKDFNENSDLDIFIITDKELTLKEQDEIYYIISELIPKFGRDITVMVYDIKGLKKVPSWQTLNLVRDACFVYDRGGIEEIFKMILKKAEEQEIVYDDEEGVFKLKKVGRHILFLDK